MKKLTSLNFIFLTSILLSNNFALSMDEKTHAELAEVLLEKPDIESASATSDALQLSINGDAEEKITAEGAKEEKPLTFKDRIFGAARDIKQGFLNLTELPELAQQIKDLPKNLRKLPKNIAANGKNLVALMVSGGIAIGASYIFPDDAMLRYAAQANFGRDFHNFIKKSAILAKLAISYGLSYGTGNLDEILPEGYATNIWYSFWLACVFSIVYKANQSRTPDKKLVETFEDVEKCIITFNPELAKILASKQAKKEKSEKEIHEIISKEVLKQVLEDLRQRKVGEGSALQHQLPDVELGKGTMVNGDSLTKSGGNSPTGSGESSPVSA